MIIYLNLLLLDTTNLEFVVLTLIPAFLWLFGSGLSLANSITELTKHPIEKDKDAYDKACVLLTGDSLSFAYLICVLIHKFINTKYVEDVSMCIRG